MNYVLKMSDSIKNNGPVTIVLDTTELGGATYCTFNGHFSLDLSTENAEIVENCP